MIENFDKKTDEDDYGVFNNNGNAQVEFPVESYSNMSSS
jgi:hypothetical protein